MTAAPEATGKTAEKKQCKLAPYLLGDLEVVDFIVNGYHIVKPDLRPGLNEAVAAKLDVMQRNPGDAICDEVPELNEVLDHPAVRGALVSLAGKNFAVMFHRHWHCKEPGTPYMHWHQDGIPHAELMRSVARRG